MSWDSGLTDEIVSGCVCVCVGVMRERQAAVVASRALLLSVGVSSVVRYFPFHFQLRPSLPVSMVPADSAAVDEVLFVVSSAPGAAWRQPGHEDVLANVRETYHAMPYRTIPCLIIPYHAMSYHIMPCRVVSCLSLCAAYLHSRLPVCSLPHALRRPLLVTNPDPGGPQVLSVRVLRS
jgi:hypothetical protein